MLYTQHICVWYSIRYSRFFQHIVCVFAAQTQTLPAEWTGESQLLLLKLPRAQQQRVSPQGVINDQVSFNKAGYQLLIPGGVAMIPLISLLEKPENHIFLEQKSTCKTYSKHFQAVLGGKVRYWGLAI